MRELFRAWRGWTRILARGRTGRLTPRGRLPARVHWAKLRGFEGAEVSEFRSGGKRSRIRSRGGNDNAEAAEARGKLVPPSSDFRLRPTSARQVGAVRGKSLTADGADGADGKKAESGRTGNSTANDQNNTREAHSWSRKTRKSSTGGRGYGRNRARFAVGNSAFVAVSVLGVAWAVRYQHEWSMVT